LGEQKQSKRSAKQGPLVSIVMPAFNSAAFIDEAIHSVIGQTYENWELIIVDDGSTDNTLDILKQFKSEKIKVLEMGKNSGAAQARNKGIRASKGAFLCFIDADDLWQPDKLASQLDFMAETDAAFSFTSYVFANAEGKLNGKVVRVPSTITYKQALRNTTIWTSTVMFDMSKLTKDDVEMPDVKSEDTATWWRILRKIDKAYGMYGVSAIYRRVGKTLSSNKFVAVRRTWNLYRKQEGLNVVRSSINFMGYAFNAMRRRI
jgi:teichuronic acid biosynthesis glycosyltransferase TuaG